MTQQPVTDDDLKQFLNQKTTTLKVFGSGGAGNNTLDTLYDRGIQNVQLIALNTDAQDLLDTKAHKKILLGRTLTKGLGAGNNPEIGEKAAQESIEEIHATVQGSNAVFVTAGMGGGTGTGSIAKIAHEAKRLGILTIGVVTLPFTVEGTRRINNANEGILKLAKATDALIVIPNDKLFDLAPDLPMITAFKLADEILANAIIGITELVTRPGLINLDFADLKTIMKNSGIAMIGVGESDTQDRATDAIHKAMSNPLLDVNLATAAGALINITGGQDFQLKEAYTIVEEVNKALHADAKILWGAYIDKTQDRYLKVLLVATGLKSTSFIDAKAIDGFVDVKEL